MNKRIEFTLSLFLLFFFWMFSKDIKAASISEIKPNTLIRSRLTYENRNLTYKVIIDKNGYQYFDFIYNENSLNEFGEGFEINVYDKDKKLIESYEGFDKEFFGGYYGFQKGDIVYIEIKEYFDVVDRVNGIPIEFNFHTEKTPYTETEKNGSFETADKLSPNQDYRGSMRSALDEDYFKFQVPKKGTTEIFFRAKNLGETYKEYILDGWKIEIFDKNKNIIHKSSNVTRHYRSPELRLSKGEVIYVKVSVTTPEAFPYFQEYNLTAVSKGGKNQEAENNNSFKKANKLTSKATGFLTNDEDKDYFVFKAKKTKKYIVRLKSDDLNEKSFVVSIYKKQKGKPLIQKITDESASFNLKLNKGEKVWIKIAGNSGLTPIQIDYNLSVK